MTPSPKLKNFPYSPDWILYQDESLLVVNKPSGLLSVPGRGEAKNHSLYTLLCQQFGEIFMVHRLDMDTSGIMVIAKNKAVHRHLSIQFQDRQTTKYYEAICAGLPSTQKGKIHLPMRCDWEKRPLQMIDPLQGKSATTLWEVTQPYNSPSGKNHAFKVKLTPITGRSHQLRLHMKTLGHPILGDNLYADKHSLTAASRLLLHASSLQFKHPISHQLLSFNCPHTLERAMIMA